VHELCCAAEGAGDATRVKFVHEPCTNFVVRPASDDDLVEPRGVPSRDAEGWDVRDVARDHHPLFSGPVLGLAC
jgi:hypothetical protein